MWLMNFTMCFIFLMASKESVYGEVTGNIEFVLVSVLESRNPSNIVKLVNIVFGTFTECETRLPFNIAFPHLVQVEENFRGKSYGTRNRDAKLGVPDLTGQVRLRLVEIVGANATAVW